MAWWKAYLLSIIGCALFCGILVQIVSDLRSRKMIQLLCGMLLAITLLRPLSSISIDDTWKFDMEGISPDTYIDMGRQEAKNVQEECIMEACESYVTNKAKDFDMLVTADISLDENMRPVSARINVKSDSGKFQILEQILEEDLGITKENQTWIWDQEKNSS